MVIVFFYGKELDTHNLIRKKSFSKGIVLRQAGETPSKRSNEMTSSYSLVKLIVNEEARIEGLEPVINQTMEMLRKEYRFLKKCSVKSISIIFECMMLGDIMFTIDSEMIKFPKAIPVEFTFDLQRVSEPVVGILATYGTYEGKKVIFRNVQGEEPGSDLSKMGFVRAPFVHNSPKLPTKNIKREKKK